MVCPKADASMAESMKTTDAEAMEEVLVLAERLTRKVETLYEPELRDRLEGEADGLLKAVYVTMTIIEEAGS